jgi:nucleoside-diphosphate-sugar epimerase
MRILFTGATGVIGRRAVPELIHAGHDVTTVVRTEEGRTWFRAMGARPLELDLFDPAAVTEAVAGHHAIVHMATAIPNQKAMPKRASWAMNDRLRSEATAHLVDAALVNDVDTLIQQSISFVYADGGDAWLDEGYPVETVWDALDSALEAERQITRFAAAGGHGVVLRFSSIYGPGEVSSEYVASVAARKLPIVGSGDNYVAHLHVADAGTAIVAALAAPTGIYNVTDDTPVTKRAEMKALATTLAVPPPRRMPAWLARAVVGPATNMLTVSHRVSNERFKDATGWAPRLPSVITGWEDAVADRTRVG